MQDLLDPDQRTLMKAVGAMIIGLLIMGLTAASLSAPATASSCIVVDTGQST